MNNEDSHNINTENLNKHIKNVNDLVEKNLTLGDKLSDKMAEFAGSWKFIISFSSLLILWIAINSSQLLFKSFDPFPFILLNLLLSCTAAFQAPIIMMSQNRQEKKDRIRSEHDYEINLKAENLIEEVINRLECIENNQKKLFEYLNKDKETDLVYYNDVLKTTTEKK